MLILNFEYIVLQCFSLPEDVTVARMAEEQ